MSENWDAEKLGGSIKRNIVNPDLIEERKNCAFNQDELIDFMLTPEIRKQVDTMARIVKENPSLKTGFEYYEMNRGQKIQEWWRRYKIMFEKKETADIILNNSSTINSRFYWSYMFVGSNPLHLHQTMFTQSIAFLGSEKQAKEYLKQADHHNIIGCYAQTEIGHGSNVAGLETTATLDLEADQFVIHTPNIKATKFWPGALGVHATHAIVFARTISMGNDYGVMPFIVQIRDMETHQPLPGVEVGDLGEKLGYNQTDNGFLSFNNYRTSRKTILSRFASIDKNGDIKMKADPRIIYQIMSATRLLIINGCSQKIYQASLIAVRYAICRRQFKNQPGNKKERKLLDYQTHMDTIFPIIAKGFVIGVTASRIEELLLASNKASLEGDFKLLDIMHHLTSGIKAIATEMAYQGIDQLRQSCGGIGFANSAGMVMLWQEVSPFPTFEGVNVVMLQQSAKLLLKNAAKAFDKKKPCREIFAYLNKADALISSKSQAKTVDDFLDLEFLAQTLATRAADVVKETYFMLKKSDAKQKLKENDIFALDVQKMIRSHLLFAMFYLAKDRVLNYSWKDTVNQNMLIMILRIFAVKMLMDDHHSLLELGYFDRQQIKLMREAYHKLLFDMRPHALHIVEFCPPLEDSIVSSIGNYHGDIYETNLETARKSNLNQNEYTANLFNNQMKQVMNQYPAPKL